VSAQPPRKLREERIKLDGGECANCSSTEQLQVHHIVPVANGGNDKLENLQTLCSDCHSKAHGDNIGFIQEETPTNKEKQDKWIPTVGHIRELVSTTRHPTNRAILVLLAKTNIGLSELTDIKTKDLHVDIESDLTSSIEKGSQPYLLIQPNNKRQGKQKRLCETEIPLDKETKWVLLKYLLIRPDSTHNNFFLYTSGDWGKPMTQRAITNRVQKAVNNCSFSDENKNKFTPSKVRIFFRERYPGQSSVSSYISGQKKSLPFPREELFERYLNNVYSLL
jgi:hypothetical protein